jgi:hypothetical protein
MNLPEHLHRGSILAPDILERLGGCARPAAIGFRAAQQRKGQGIDRPGLGRRPGLLAHLSAPHRIAEARRRRHHGNPPAMDRPSAGPARLPARIPSPGNRAQRQERPHFPPHHQEIHEQAANLFHPETCPAPRLLRIGPLPFLQRLQFLYQEALFIRSAWMAGLAI